MLSAFPSASPWNEPLACLSFESVPASFRTIKLLPRQLVGNKEWNEQGEHTLTTRVKLNSITKRSYLQFTHICLGSLVNYAESLGIDCGMPLSHLRVNPYSRFPDRCPCAWSLQTSPPNNTAASHVCQCLFEDWTS